MSDEFTVTSVAHGITASFVDPSSMTLLGGGHLSVGLNHDLGSVQVTMTDEQRGLAEVVHFGFHGDHFVTVLERAADSSTETWTEVAAIPDTHRSSVFMIEIGIDPEVVDEVYLSSGFAVGMVFLSRSAARNLAGAVRAVMEVAA